MIVAIYDENFRKTAGDPSLPAELPASFRKAALPFREDDLYCHAVDGGQYCLVRETEKPAAAPRTRNELLQTLLSGTGGDLRALCARYSYPYDCVRRVMAAETEGDVSAYAADLTEMLDDGSVTVSVCSEHRLVLTVGEGDTPWQEMAGALAATLAELGTDYSVGVSCPCENASELAEGYRQALAAVATGKKLSFSGVWSYAGLLPEMLAENAPDGAWLEKAEKIGRTVDEETWRLLREFFDHNQNISETARYCYMHRNTLIYKLDWVMKKTGFDPRCFDDAVALRICMAANKVLK